MPESPSSRHFTALDGFRGVAIVLVMWSHFIVAGGLVDKSNAFFRLLNGGFVGVDMFFVLSGFLITGILLDAPKTGIRYFSVFYLRRSVRIFPLYYAILAGVYLTRPPAPTRRGGTGSSLPTSGPLSTGTGSSRRRA